jgi:L-fuculose-phosphate aldolase
MSSMQIPARAAALLAVYRAMVEYRLNVGTSGNVSARQGDGFAITPSGLRPEQCTASDMVTLTMEGARVGPPAKHLTPSSEWRIHRDIYACIPEAGAVLHAHSAFATALACQRAEIPPFHYMIARFGGDTVRCAAYATFGSETLSRNALVALDARTGCLLANHGMLVYGPDLEGALTLALELETLCEQYWRTCQIGPPVLLTAEELAEAAENFRWYGKPRQE